MASHYEIRPDERGLALRVASRALRVASGLATARPGNVFIPNKDEDGFSDGTGTWIGSGAVGNGGVAPWVGDTTPPGRPAGVSATSAWGTVYAKWDGTLEGGVPADFAYVEVSIDGAVVGRLTEAGAVAADGYGDGHEATVTFVAYDAARLMDGTLSPNASEAATVTVTVSDERDQIDADVEQARQDAASAAERADEAWDKAEAQSQQVAQAVQAAQDASDKADEVASDLASKSEELSGMIGDVSAEVDGLTTRVEGAASDAGSALAHVSELSQDVDGVRATAQSALETAEGTQKTVATLSTTVGGIEQSVEQVTETAESALTKATEVETTAAGIQADISANYLSKEDASETYATQASLEATSDSLTASVSEAATKADSAMTKATTVEQTAAGIRSDLTETTQTAESALEKATSVEATASGLSATMKQVQRDVSAAQSTADDAADAAEAAQSAADSASSAASKAQSTADSVSTRVTTLSATVDGISADVEQVTETASDALSRATSAQQDVDGFKTTVSQTYVTKADAEAGYQPKGDYATSAELDSAIAQEVLDRDSAIEQTAESITQTVSETYQPKGDYLTDSEAGATYATKAALTQTSDSILSEVEKTYQSKDGMSSYYTKSEVDQRDDSITQTVSQAVTTADGAYEKATTLEQTVDGFEATLTETANTANEALSTARGNGQLLYECKVAPDADYGWVLLTADSTLDDDGNTGYAHIWGWMGGWTGPSGGYIDVMIPLRNTAYDNIVVTQKDDQIASYGSGNGASLRVYSVDDKARVTIAVKGYAQVRIFVEGTGFTINNVSGQSDQGTYIWDSDGAQAQNAKTATNYLGFSSGGLVVGTNSSGTGQSGLQGNVRLTSGGMEVRNGTTVLSRYGASTTELGINSTSATTTMCGGVASIAVTKSGSNATMLIETLPASSSGGYGSIVLRPRHVGTSVTQIEVTGDGAITLSTPNRINLNAVGDVWNESAPICQGVQAVFGMKVVKTGGDSTCNIESFSSLTSKVGFTVGRYNCVLHATTSDFAAYHQRLDSYASVDSIGIIGSGPNVNIRVNYVIFCWPG